MSLPGTILAEKVIPVGRGLDSTTAPGMVDALRAGGINSIEITMEVPGAIEAIKSVADSPMLVGAGTVVNVSQAEEAMRAGAVFIVSPHLDVELLEWAGANGVPLIPGAFSPTEIATAWRHEPPAVKVFPASLGGPGYLRSLAGPYPKLSLIPTGGIDADNVGDFLEAGAVAVGVGGWLTGHDDLDLVTERAALLRTKVV